MNDSIDKSMISFDISSSRTVWEDEGLQLMSDDIARLLGLDVRTIDELCDEDAFAHSLPEVSGADLIALRGPKNAPAAADRVSTLPCDKNEIESGANSVTERPVKKRQCK